MTKNETKPRLQRVRAGQLIRASAWNEMVDSLNRPYDTAPSPGGEGALNGVALTAGVIPKRVGTTAGGPVSVTLQALDGTGNFAPGDSIEVYSWVKADSADPADHGGSLYIFVEQDADGVWWYTGQDCTDPPAAFEVIPDGSTMDSGSEVYYVT